MRLTKALGQAKGNCSFKCVFPSTNLAFLKKSFGVVLFGLHPLHKRGLIGDDDGGLIGGFFFVGDCSVIHKKLICVVFSFKVLYIF